jgi:hypothetical protein
MKRWAATTAMVLALLGVSMAPAHADPINAPNVEPFQITCAGATFTVVVPGATGQGQWTPALVTTSNQVLIPLSFHITVTNVATGEVVFEEEVSKAAASHVATTTCTFGETFTEDGQTFVFEGTVEVLLTPVG